METEEKMKDNVAPDEMLPKDETFEIISEKEKFWRDELVKAETSHINAEAGLLIAEKLITLSKTEIKKEADKNAH